MIRRNFIKGLSILGAGTLVHTSSTFAALPFENGDERAFWANMLSRITFPVLDSLSKDNLRKRMPVEAFSKSRDDRKNVAYLEALGRSLAGMAPWLELGDDGTEEGILRGDFIKLATASIGNAVTPTASDYMNFTEGGQPLVDAAFLAHALIRSPHQLWGKLDDSAKENLLAALRATRKIKPYYSNWLLFSAMIEAALLKFSGDYDSMRIDYAVRQHEAWYKGDGMYGDGPEFHFDYYNSFVIQPMLIDIVAVVSEMTGEMSDILARVHRRARRYAEIQERLISPEGTFPPVGRSLAYRCGAFQLLAQMALQKNLPDSLSPSQVRSALTAVLRTTLGAGDTFDKNGWLTIGLCGHQPEVGEYYISTGSLYLCTQAFLPLGLPSDDEFWTGPAMDWTSKKAFAGKPFRIDKALGY